MNITKLGVFVFVTGCSYASLTTEPSVNTPANVRIFDPSWYRGWTVTPEEPSGERIGTIFGWEPKDFTNWVDDKGVRIPNNDVGYLCGNEISVQSVDFEDKPLYGRVFLFGPKVGSSGGPTARGDYSIDIDAEAAFSATDGGRFTVQWETYKNGEYSFYAWVVLLSREPLLCEEHSKWFEPLS